MNKSHDESLQPRIINFLQLGSEKSWDPNRPIRQNTSRTRLRQTMDFTLCARCFMCLFWAGRSVSGSGRSAASWPIIHQRQGSGALNTCAAVCDSKLFVSPFATVAGFRRSMVMANGGQSNSTSAKFKTSYLIRYSGALCHSFKPAGLGAVDSVGHCLWELTAQAQW